MESRSSISACDERVNGVVRPSFRRCDAKTQAARVASDYWVFPVIATERGGTAVPDAPEEANVPSLFTA